jgi:outer membrane immunogenic protein
LQGGHAIGTVGAVKIIGAKLMRRIVVAAFVVAALSAGSFNGASAADLPTKAPVYKAPPATIATWTGCYMGGNVGYGWSPTKWSDPVFAVFVPGELASHTADGVVGGGQLGCDYQKDQWVFGVQGMLDGSAMKGQSLNSLSLGFGNEVIDATKIRWLATLTGRIGYTLQPTTLLYAKGGFAWARVNYNECCTPPDTVTDGFAKVTRTGWTVGAGVEHMIQPHWSVFLEYDFVGLGKDHIAFTPYFPFSAFSYNIDQDIHLVLAGVNYRF